MDENALSNIVGSLIQKDGDSFTSWNGIWILLLFFLFFGGGFGGFGNRQTATTNDVNTGFQFNALENDVRANGSAINTLGYQNLQQTGNIVQNMNNGFANVSNNFCEVNRNVDAVRYDISQAACGVNRNIDAVRAEMAQNTCAITSTDTANTQKILDRLCAMEAAAKDNTIAQLRTDLQAAQLTLSNAAQTQNIVSAVRPTPVPAYITSSPYASYYGTTFA